MKRTSLVRRLRDLEVFSRLLHETADALADHHSDCFPLESMSGELHKRVRDLYRAARRRRPAPAARPARK